MKNPTSTLDQESALRKLDRFVEKLILIGLIFVTLLGAALVAAPRL